MFFEISENKLALANMHSVVIEKGAELVIDRLGRFEHVPINQAVFDYAVAPIFRSMFSLPFVVDL